MNSTWIDTPVGRLLAVADDSGIAALNFADDEPMDDLLGRLRKRFTTRGDSSAIVPGEHPHLTTLKGELAEYFAGRRQDFSVPLAPRGTAFEMGAWAFLNSIPFAETRSYREQAVAIGSPRAMRAVGQANGRNCMAIVIPCHRVIGASGGLTGYGGGVARKQWLLAHERKVMELMGRAVTAQKVP